jgi:hypothetical protein
MLETITETAPKTWSVFIKYIPPVNCTYFDIFEVGAIVQFITRIRVDSKELIIKYLIFSRSDKIEQHSIKVMAYTHGDILLETAITKPFYILPAEKV